MDTAGEGEGGMNQESSTDVSLLLLLLLSRFSRVRLCATPQTAATRLPIPGILQARTLEWGAIAFPVPFAINNILID